MQQSCKIYIYSTILRLVQSCTSLMAKLYVKAISRQLNKFMIILMKKFLFDSHISAYVRAFHCGKNYQFILGRALSPLFSKSTNISGPQCVNTRLLAM